MSARQKGCALLHVRARFCRFPPENVHFCLFFEAFPVMPPKDTGLFVRPLAEIVVRILRLAEDVDDHFVLPGRKAPLPDTEVQCREACP